MQRITQRRLLLGSIAALLCWSEVVQAQDAEVRAILRKFKNYRYSTVSIFRLEGQVFADVQELLNPMPKAPEVVANLQSTNPALYQQIQDRVTLEGCAADIQEVLRKLREEDGVPPGIVNRAETIEAVKYAVQVMQNNCNAFKNAFAITTRYRPGEPFTIIALIKTRDRSRTIARDLRNVQDADILLFSELRRIAAPPTSPSATLYDYLATAVIQGAIENVTLEAQGIGDEETQFAPPTFGNAEPVWEDDIQTYLRISEGQPLDYAHPSELVVSFPDLIRYRYYTIPADAAEEAATEAEEEQIYNRYIPRLGLELRYGLEELNYPSIWSQRLTVNALWSSARLGMVLPLKGWSQLASKLGARPRLTTAGWGMYGTVDFPVKLIQEGGVFQASGSYVFGDARKSDHQTWNAQLQRSTDFFIRYHAQLHYSFSIAIDKNYFFRFKLGGTIYGAETWAERSDTTEDRSVLHRFVEEDDEVIGGISGGVDFMSTGLSTPYGFTLQYFDDTMLGTVWLQIPVTRGFALRFDGRLFACLLREARPWEQKTLFFPSARVVLNF
ncbi:MAG: hypothetical protein NZ473_03735 [Candidatus Kapabacteria bacterium]|nr:hypothetical protein [Candidatus Kapabacteria bacterium]MDW8225432.1 hypothetical protein [Bacteroidota bacterium]